MFFSQPLYFLLLILIVPYVVWYVLRNRKSEPVMVVSSLSAFRGTGRSIRDYLLHLPFLLHIACYSLVVCALARPQTTDGWNEQNLEGIDIMMCMDVSTSMLARDLEPDRVTAARNRAIQFIKNRPNDNIGLTIFAGEAFTQCPMTTNHSMLLSTLGKLDCEIAANGVISDGTAIGMGITNAVSRLKDSKAKSKVIIMLTDGSNNMGEITPSDAAQMAKDYDIRVYTIGVGKDGKVPYPYKVAGMTETVYIDSDIDEDALRKIANTTDAKYFRATSERSLEEIYNEIDKMEKTKLNVTSFNTYNECFMPFLLAAVCVLIAEMLLRLTLLRRIP